jgi:hypothetical protein
MQEPYLVTKFGAYLPSCGRSKIGHPPEEMRLPLEQVDGLAEVGDADVAGQGGMLAFER